MQNTNLPEPIECDRKVIKEHQKMGITRLSQAGP